MEASDLAIACKLTDSDFQQRRAGLLKTVAGGVVETKELEDGYAYRFPSGMSWLATLAKLITVERECCPLLRFNLRLEPAEGQSGWNSLAHRVQRTSSTPSSARHS